MHYRFLQKLDVNAAAVIAEANDNNYEGENVSTLTKMYCTLISKLISVRRLKTFKNIWLKQQQQKYLWLLISAV